MTTSTHRLFITAPGERLFLSADALLAASRVAEFADLTGLDLEHVVSDPVVTTPMPLYIRGAKFTGVNAEALWHPLFWLPEDVALRLQVAEADGSTRIETDAEWLVRVAIEVQHAGLYDADQGWVDVLALAGLDIDNPVDVARVEAWQSGDGDRTLDTIDLSSRFTLGREDAFELAASTLASVQPAQWALTAASLLGALEATDEPEALIELAALMLDEEGTGAAEALLAPGLTTEEAIEALSDVFATYEGALAAISARAEV